MSRPSTKESKEFNVNYPPDTDFSASARLLQSKWRQNKKYLPGKLGNFLKPGYAKAGKFNFLTSNIRELVTNAVANSRNEGAVISEPRIWENLLWNLLPTDQKVNGSKSDKIIRLETLHKCEDRIVYYWQIQNKTYPERFQNELSRTLLGTRTPVVNWEKPALTALSKAVEMLAIQRGAERWGG